MKNLANYSDPNKIGTVHWFRTLVGQAKRMGEFLKDKGHDVYYYKDEIRDYGQKIENIMNDLIEWQETNQPLKLI